MARLQLLILSTSITFSHKKGVSSDMYPLYWTTSKGGTYQSLRLFIYLCTFYLKAPNKAAMLGRLINAFTKTEPSTAGIV